MARKSVFGSGYGGNPRETMTGRDISQSQRDAAERSANEYFKEQAELKSARQAQSLRQEADSKRREADTIVRNVNSSRGANVNKGYAAARALRDEAKELERDAMRIERSSDTRTGEPATSKSTGGVTSPEVYKGMLVRDIYGDRGNVEMVNQHGQVVVAYPGGRRETFHRANVHQEKGSSYAAYGAQGPGGEYKTLAQRGIDIKREEGNIAELQRQNFTREGAIAKLYEERMASAKTPVQKAEAAWRRDHASNGWQDQPRVPAGEPDGGQWTKA